MGELLLHHSIHLSFFMGLFSFWELFFYQVHVRSTHLSFYFLYGAYAVDSWELSCFIACLVAYFLDVGK